MDRLTVTTPAAAAVERLNADECWRLLSEAPIGRLAVAALTGVEIFPINIAVDHRRIVFRTNIGEKLLDLTIRPDVALEIDGWTHETAWSVVAKGVAMSPELRTDLRHLNGLGLGSWSPTHKSAYVEITPTSLEGRRFARVDERDPEWR